MSTSRPPQRRNPLVNSTRQMLDELDALMERMLALPVNELEEGPKPASAPAEISPELIFEEPPSPKVEPARLLKAEEPVRSSATTSQVLVGKFSVLPTFVPEKPAAPAAEKKGIPPEVEEEPGPASPDPWSESVPAPEEILPPLVVVPPRLEHIRVSPPRRSWFGLVWRPFCWANQSFDSCTQWLGGPGRWLRSAQGRMVLGCLGLGLLALATAWWIHDWMGWSWTKESLE